MQFKVKEVNISSGGPLVAIINVNDANSLDLKALDRIKIKKDRKEIVVAVDISKGNRVKKGQLGLFEEVTNLLKLNNNSIIDVSVEPKPISLQYIKKKLDGERLNKNEINEIVKDIVENRLTEIEITYFISGCYVNGMSLYESAYLTEAIVDNGKKLNLNKYPILDKHSISGVPGNRTTMIIIPIVTAMGYIMPKTSTRSITSASVSYDTPIFIKENNINKLLKIGPFIDEACKNAKNIKKENDSEYLEVKNNKYKVPVFSNDFKISYKPLTGIFRHKAPDSLMHIKLVSGRSVYVTKDHSLFTLQNGEIISKPTNQFKENDIIIAPKTFISKDNIKEIDLVEELKNNLTDNELDYIFVEGIDKNLVKKFMANKNTRDHMRYYRNLIPLSILKREKIKIPENVTLRHSDSKLIFNKKIKITKELIKLLGYYAAEGHCRNHCVEFYLGSHEKEFIKDLEVCTQKVFNTKAIVQTRKTRLSETDIRIHGKLISLIFKHIFDVGNSSYEKKIPNLIFNVGKELQKIYLDSYLVGDGYKRTSRDTGFAGTTVSKDLINGLQYLSTILGIGYSTRIDYNKIRDFGTYVSKCAPAHHIYLSKNNITKQSIATTNQIPVFESGLYKIAMNNYGILNSSCNNFQLGYNLLNQKTISFTKLKDDFSHLYFNENVDIKKINKIINGDLSFLRIKSIEKVPYKQEWVYDLCVRGHEKFVGGNGAIFLHNSGTSDTFEVLAPVEHSVNEIRKIINKTGGCMVWGGAMELASADDKLIKVEKTISLDPEGIMLASILAKKSSVGATHVILDIPWGHGSKIDTIKVAKRLRNKFEILGKLLGMEIKTFFSDGRQPIGNGIGPALEARDVLLVLENKGPLDLKEKALKMTSILLSMVGVKNSYVKALGVLESGLALKKMKEIIKAQGGNPNISSGKIKIGKFKCDIKSKSSGIVKEIFNKNLVKIAKAAGAPEDKGAGIYLNVKLNNKIKKNQVLLSIYADNKKRLQYARQIYSNSKVINIEK